MPHNSIAAAALVLVFSTTAAPPQTQPIVVKMGEPEAVKTSSTTVVSTRRYGSASIAGAEKAVAVTIRGQNGIYDRDFLTVAFDVNGDGTFDPEIERYLVSDKYVNIGGSTYAFAVAADGSTMTLTRLALKRPDRVVIKTGYPSLNFSFVDIDGTKRQLSDYRGKVVLLDFWGSWCPGCIEGAPELAAAYAQYHSRSFEIIGIDANDTPSQVREFTKKHDMPWTQTIEKEKGTIGALYRIQGWPTAFLIGPDGQFLAATYGGDVDLKAELSKLFPAR